MTDILLGGFPNRYFEGLNSFAPLMLCFFFAVLCFASFLGGFPIL